MPAMVQETKEELRRLVYSPMYCSDPDLQLARIRAALGLPLLDFKGLFTLSQHDAGRAIEALKRLRRAS